MPKFRAHVATSDMPLPEGKALGALCGARVAHAAWLFKEWDSVHLGLPSIPTFYRCTECWRRFETQPLAGSLVYCFSEAQTVLDGDLD